MVLEYQLPGCETLEGHDGMRKLFGYISDDNFRVHVYVPTTSFNSLDALVIIYYPRSRWTSDLPDRPEPVLAKRAVRIKAFPKWNMGLQCLDISAADEALIKKAIEKLEPTARNTYRKHRQDISDFVNGTRGGDAISTGNGDGESYRNANTSPSTYNAEEVINPETPQPIVTTKQETEEENDGMDRFRMLEFD